MAEAKPSPAHFHESLHDPHVPKPVDLNDPRNAPFHWLGGKWFVVRDYALSHDFSTAVKSFTAGSFAGCLSKTVVAPAERVKVMAQTDALHGGRCRSYSHIARDVLREEGFRSFWRGNGANCVRIIPNKGILFMCNDYYVAMVATPGQPLSDWKRLLCGSMSGATVVTFTYPLDITQTRLASGAKFNGIWDCMMSTLRTEGLFTGLYRGYFTSLAGIIPYTGVQFYTYEKVSALFRDENGKAPVWSKLFAGACSGVISQTTTYPTDVVRRQLQAQGRVGDTKFSGPGECIKHIWKTAGVRGFFRGCWINGFRAAPSQAVQFWSYSAAKEFLGIKE